MQRLLIATKNPGKLKELIQFLSDLPLELVSLTDLGIEEEMEETAETYFENSKQKAVFYSKLSNLPVIADDGGLEIEALGGVPGVKSRRWLGYHATDEELIEYTKKIARELPENNRHAAFKTVITLALPNGKYFQEYGEVKGIIAKNPHQKLLHGYPYRSFFYIPELKKYYHESELTDAEQIMYNHRYKAIEKLKPKIKEILC